MEMTISHALLSELPSIDVEDKKLADKIPCMAMKNQIFLDRTLSAILLQIRSQALIVLPQGLAVLFPRGHKGIEPPLIITPKN